MLRRAKRWRMTAQQRRKQKQISDKAALGWLRLRAALWARRAQRDPTNLLIRYANGP